VRAAVEVLYRLALALWVGGMGIFTFLLTPTIFRTFGRDEAGRIVGVLFPGYFTYLLVLSILACGCFWVVSRGPRRLTHWACFVLLLAAVAANCVSRFHILPAAERLRSEIGSFAAAPPDDALRRKFGRLHGQSMALNLTVLADGVLLLILPPFLRR
jgi:hypothetical protein